MAIFDDLTLSQASLQDYVECPYRFRLRYLDCLEWPAVEAEPASRNERMRRDGSDFHRMVHQYLLGVPAKQLQALAEHKSSKDGSDVLSAWWRSFCTHWPADLPGKCYPEVTLAADVSGRRLMAKYDLIVVEKDAAVILDWKTASDRPADATVEGRLQTRVYPYLLALAGAALNDGTPISPERIEMRYWYTAFPNEPTIIPYGSDQYKLDKAHLTELLEGISKRPLEGFERTDDLQRCQLCTYRSLCGRGKTAGHGDLEDEVIGDFVPSIDDGDDTMTLDYAQVGEASF